MSRTKRIFLQIIRVFLGLLTLLWLLSLAGAYVSIFSEPNTNAQQFLQAAFVTGLVFLPAWGYFKLTKILESSVERNN